MYSFCLKLDGNKENIWQAAFSTRKGEWMELMVFDAFVVTFTQFPYSAFQLFKQGKRLANPIQGTETVHEMGVSITDEGNFEFEIDWIRLINSKNFALKDQRYTF